ncbi:endoplasmic reticulum metallopeptidase 1-like [Pimephales promelas]|uniref:endoplasmic reticulum metallopeptidase 1-like n=1 Tax=Pimephales promelas TaxID=90988 RepID=UPI0019556474|nr:endoplasmic reticulum metallopeptidase 1-like [Pimephales promelas]
MANLARASDDAVSCSVMLEILRSLANLSTPLKHGVIFLFNGAEANMLKVRGIDLAFIENGYLYHTKYDTPERIHIDSIQRAGDNILSVLKHLVMSDELADSSEHRHGNMVFFDLLGLTMVAYPAHVGTIINYVFAVATVIYLGWKCMLNSSVGCRCTRDLARVCIAVGCRYTRDLVCAVVMVVLSWGMALLTVLLVAWLVTLMGRSMFWYTHFYAAVSLYGSAAASMILLIHTLAKSLYYRVSEGTKHTTHDSALVKRHQSI